MSTRALRHRNPSRSGATPRTEACADTPAVRPQAPLSKATAARLARLGAADMPWLGRGEGAMLAGYDGPEVSGAAEYAADLGKGR